MDSSRRNPPPVMKPYRRPNDGAANTPRLDNNSRPQSQERKRTVNAFLPLRPDLQITNEMQITDGKYRGFQLQTTLAPKLRPTASRVRHALFHTLGKRIRFTRFLDLCAGSGSVGVEAISRGSSLCTFLERSAKMCHFIRLNLKACEINPSGHGEVVQMEAIPFLNRMAARGRRWDIIYFDPPYNADYDEVLGLFARGACLRKDGGILVIEHHAEMFFPQTLGKLRRVKVVREGDMALTFYERTA
ncbi:MAG: 16S rRNA (guanine(966)-N(2))-methyltransferase RsmD [Pyrinomonadaceae bacterium]